MLIEKDIISGLKEILLTIDPNKKDIVDKANRETRLIEDLGLASISLLYFVIAIEEKFGIEFGDVGVNEFKNVGNAVDYILAKAA